MLSRKMFERINWYKKEYIHDYYSRIIIDFKDYEKISRTKMLEEVYKVYDNPENILDICTFKELKYLQMIIENSKPMPELLDSKYDWERDMLHKKFLIQDDFKVVFIPDEIIDQVKKALAIVDWSKVKKADEINEIAVSYCKMLGSTIFYQVCTITSSITGINDEEVFNHLNHNRLFKFYVYVYNKDFQHLNQTLPVALYNDYYTIGNEIETERKKQGIKAVPSLDVEFLKRYFYNDFDIKNPKIAKFIKEIKKLPILWHDALRIVREYAILNIDRTPLKQSFKDVPSLQKHNLTSFFHTLDEAMDEMPSGALNGLTPNQAKNYRMEQEQIKHDKEQNYIKQQNACLSKKDADLFYKIYFALLEFTNKKFQIKKDLKIYQQNHLNPHDLTNIIAKFWENKETLTQEFCQTNPYKFNSEELDITSNFQKGFRGHFIVVKFEEEYTAVMDKDKTYMIKGINDNIDNILSYQNLPVVVTTSIIPFKNFLIYDGIFYEFSISLGSNFTNMINQDFQKSLKYYHL